MYTIWTVLGCRTILRRILLDWNGILRKRPWVFAVVIFELKHPNQVRQRKWLPLPFSLSFYSLYSRYRFLLAGGVRGWSQIIWRQKSLLQYSSLSFSMEWPCDTCEIGGSLNLAPIYAKFIDVSHMGQLHRKRYKRIICNVIFVVLNSTGYMQLPLIPPFSSILFPTTIFKDWNTESVGKKAMTTFPVVLMYSSLGDWQKDNDGQCNASDDLQPCYRLAARKPLTLCVLCRQYLDV